MDTVKVPFDGNVTKCTNCAGKTDKGFGICHKGCSYGNDEDKKKCLAFNDDGFCNVCGCAWTIHINSHDYYIQEDRIIEQTNFETKK